MGSGVGDGFGAGVAFDGDTLFAPAFAGVSDVAFGAASAVWATAVAGSGAGAGCLAADPALARASGAGPAGASLLALVREVPAGVAAGVARLASSGGAAASRGRVGVAALAAGLAAAVETPAVLPFVVAGGSAFVVAALLVTARFAPSLFASRLPPGDVPEGVVRTAVLLGAAGAAFFTAALAAAAFFTGVTVAGTFLAGPARPGVTVAAATAFAGRFGAGGSGTLFAFAAPLRAALAPLAALTGGAWARTARGVRSRVVEESLLRGIVLGISSPHEGARR